MIRRCEAVSGLVAQLGERCVRIAEVEGSIPFESTKREPDEQLRFVWLLFV